MAREVHGLHPAGMTPLDIAAGGMLGTEPREPLPKIPRGDTMVDVFEAMILPALRSERCLVSFSGGRDSSWVLAGATEMARRNGLPDPVPITYRPTGIPEAEENGWQEEVVAHLGLDDWERIDVTDELNLVGPWAQTALRRHGRFFPASAFMLLPMFERARGGTLVVAQGGEEMYIYWRWARLVDALALRRRPTRGDLRMLALAMAPLPLRRRIAMRSAPPAPFPWLTGEAAREVSRIFADEVGTEPIRYSAALRGLLRHRCMSGTIRSVSALAEGAGARAIMPVLHLPLLAVWARDGGWKGWGDRTATLRRLAGDYLPDHVLARRDKTRMNRVFFGPHTHAFAERWSGGGVDPSLVDVEVLREMWLGDEHDWRTSLLMQAAWLNDETQDEHNERGSHGEQAAVASA
jgi:asparagine synthetase B (glutamine-hydrolysing)